jgi:pimeloyl-ACP methyl ester carboxylesterase
MKLKFHQRLAIGYYKTKIKTIRLVSKNKAAEKAFELFCTPYSGKPKRKKPPVFNSAEKIYLNINQLVVRGWLWHATKYNGKTILIAHGFDSCSYKFDSYIEPLTKAGFNVVAFDAPAHGVSDGKTLNALLYKNMLLTAVNNYSIDIIIAHSLGALAAALAAEEITSLQKLILIAPATETQRAIDNFFSFVTLGNAIKQDVEHLIKEIAQQPINHFSVNRIVAKINIPVLWIHDESDWICPIEDIKPTQAKNYPHVTFFITKHFGHSSIYRKQPVMQKVLEFLE